MSFNIIDLLDKIINGQINKKKTIEISKPIKSI